LNFISILDTCPGFSVLLCADIEVSQNRVLRRIFGPKREEVVGHLRRLHKEDKMGGDCSTHGRYEK
jgi:hypothetical protein